jgi:hypothetical protein
MGYWKRQYTDRPTGKPLFRPGQRPDPPAGASDAPDSADPDSKAPGEPEHPDRQSTPSETPDR